MLQDALMHSKCVPCWLQLLLLWLRSFWHAAPGLLVKQLLDSGWAAV